jgi:hypothetical protein
MYTRRLVQTAALACTLALSAISNAGDSIAACGNIEVEANAECEVLVEAECTAKCVPLNFEAACRGSLRTECSASCTDPPTLQCTATCEGECQGSCEASPGAFECDGHCQGSCEADCQGRCSAAENQGECEASCSSRCEGECSVSCEGQPIEASCEGKCEASCEGQCTVDSNFSCQLSCETSGFAECTAELQGGCQAECQSPQGALFCDGEYVDHGGNLDQCIRALDAFLSNGVNVTASASADGSAQATCQCAAPGRSTPGGRTPAFAGAALLLGLAALRRGRSGRQATSTSDRT